MSNRRVVAGVLLAVLLVTSGCTGIISGQATKFTAKPVTVSDGAQSETNYDLSRTGNQTITRTFAGQEIVVTNRIAEYAKSAELPVFADKKVARFTVLATPQVKVAGQVFNPVGRMNNTELAERLQKQYETISNLRKEGTRTETMLGTETKVTKFRADAKMTGGQSVEVFIHITRVKHAGDFVIAVAVYPTKLEGEQKAVNRLLNGVQHGS